MTASLPQGGALRRTCLLLLFLVLFSCSRSMNVSAASVRRTGERPLSVKSQTVKTLQWTAVVNTDVAAQVVGSTKTVTVKAGTSVTVLARAYNIYNQSTVQLSNRTKVKIASRYLNFQSALVTFPDYSTAVKQRFVKKYDSQTEYLIWVSLDKQRVNIFQGKKGSWKMIKCCLCSTGAVGSPTGASKNFVLYQKTYYLPGMTYVSYFSGNAIHGWPSGYGGQIDRIGKEPMSHGCVRLYEEEAKWIYDEIPIGTRVIVW